MHRSLITIGLLALASAVHAAGDGWLTSFEEAQKASKKTGYPILADFTGSDWCPPCKLLEKEIFSSDVFKKWAPKHVVLLKLDFPRTKPQPAALQAKNRALSNKYAVEAFPTVLFMKADGKEIRRISGYSSLGPSFWTKNAEILMSSSGRAMRFAPPQGTKAAAPPVAEDGYPAYVTTKTLYAKHDLRGKEAPKIEAESWLAGGTPETKGKVVLIDIWATWCPPCRELIPELNSLAAEFKDDLVVVGISDEKTDVVKGFMKKTPMNYHVGVDAKKRISGVLGVEGIPHVIVITPDGIIRWQGFPLDDKDPLTKEKLKQIIDRSKAKAGLKL